MKIFKFLRRKKSTEESFFDYIRMPLASLIYYRTSYMATEKARRENLTKLDEAVEMLFQSFDRFSKSNYGQTSRINPRTLDKLKEFKTINATSAKDLEELRVYLFSLASSDYLEKMKRKKYYISSIETKL